MTSVGLLVLAVAIAAVWFMRRGSQAPSANRRESVAWRVGVVVAIWVGLVALAMVTFLVGHWLSGDDQTIGLSGPEGVAVRHLADRDAPFGEGVWQALHPNLRRSMSRQEYVDCFHSDVGAAPPMGEDTELGRGLLANNVIVQHDSTYSVADRRVEADLVSIDVRVERADDAEVVTILLFPDPALQDGWYVVEVTPADPCLVGSEVLRGQLESTGQIAIELPEVPGLDGYEVLAGVWKGGPADGDLVGGAIWEIYEQYASDVIHPVYEGDGEAPYTNEDGGEPEEPNPKEGWGAGDYLWQEIALLEPGAHTIELWANPGELLPAGRHVPAEPFERTCTVEVAVTAGRLTRLTVTEVPTGGECIRAGG